MAISGEQFKSLSQRLRYEAFSKFATEIGKLNNFEDLNEVLAYSLKYMVSFKYARIIIQNEDITLNYILKKGKCIFCLAPLSNFETRIIQKGISIEYSDTEIPKECKEHAVPNTAHTAQNFKKMFFFPMQISQDQNLLIELIHPQETSYTENDIPLLRLIGEFLTAKVSQIYLSTQLAEKSEMLTLKNQELNQLNRQVQRLNASLEQKVKERTEELAQSNLELRTVFYRSSHDLKSPLTTLKGLLSLISTASRGNEEIELLAGKSFQTINAMGKMFDKMSLISSIYERHNSKRQININMLLHELTAKCEKSLHDQKIVPTLEIEDELNISTPKDLLLAIIEVLFENAIQFQRTGNSEKRIKIKAFASEDHVTIDIIDNGEGIENSVLPNIYDMYFRGSLLSKGHGLGLYVARKMIDIVRGRLICCSENGKGSWFRIYLPIEK